MNIPCQTDRPSVGETAVHPEYRGAVSAVAGIQQIAVIKGVIANEVKAGAPRYGFGIGRLGSLFITAGKSRINVKIIDKAFI